MYDWSVSTGNFPHRMRRFPSSPTVSACHAHRTSSFSSPENPTTFIAGPPCLSCTQSPILNATVSCYPAAPLLGSSFVCPQCLHVPGGSEDAGGTELVACIGLGGRRIGEDQRERGSAARRGGGRRRAGAAGGGAARGRA